MIWDRRSKILYPFECKTTNIRGQNAQVNMYARNRRTAKRLAFGYFCRAGVNVMAPIKVRHMRDKPLAIPVKQNKGTN